MEYHQAHEYYSDPDETSSLEAETQEPETQTRKPTKKQLEDAKVKAENERRLLNLAKARQARQQKLKEKREAAVKVPESLPTPSPIMQPANFVLNSNAPEMTMKIEPKKKVVKVEATPAPAKPEKKKIPKIKVEQEPADDSSEEVIVIKRQKPKQRTKTIYIEEESEEEEEEPIYIKAKPKKPAKKVAAAVKPKVKQHLPAKSQKIAYDEYDEYEDYDDYEYEIPSVPTELTPVQRAILQLRGY